MGRSIAETGSSPGSERGVAAAARIRSLDQAWSVFIRHGSPRVLVGGLGLAVAVRAIAAVSGAAPLSRWDAAALAVVAALVPFVEWAVHRLVLHARPRIVRGVRIDPGLGHREHHRHPASIDWVLLRTVDAVLFQAINAAVAVAVVGVPLARTGRPLLGPALTGVVMAMAALAHYEWSHFLFHTAVRPRSARYRRLKANHRRHHWRDERAWLGITSNLADRVLGTLPPPAGFRRLD
jgi:sterol desaturase/sphingolipid hydroxylase (fatty acid hydroxylase superfamily)